MVANDFIDHYQNFSPAYFSQVMDRYKKKANEVRKMMPQERIEAIPHLTDLEIIDYSYQEYKVLENRTFDRLFNPLSVFTKLNSTGIKVWTKEDGALAKKKLMEIITYKANKMDIISAKQYRDEWTEQWLKNQARAVAVALFFDLQIENNKTYINKLVNGEKLRIETPFTTADSINFLSVSNAIQVGDTLIYFQKEE
jgi:hypothetical protein